MKDTVYVVIQNRKDNTLPVAAKIFDDEIYFTKEDAYSKAYKVNSFYRDLSRTSNDIYGVYEAEIEIIRKLS